MSQKRWVIHLVGVRMPIEVPPPPHMNRLKRDDNEGDPYVSTINREGVEIFIPKWFRGDEALHTLIPWHRVSSVDTFGSGS